VISGSPADRAGIREGDIITKIGDQAIDSEHPLDLALAGFAPGQSVDLEIIRGRDTLTVTLTLGIRPGDL
jgi:S1-C subfamily serine protease